MKLKSKKEYRVVEISIQDLTGDVRTISERYHTVQVKTRKGWVEYRDSQYHHTGSSNNKFRNLKDALRFKAFLEGKLPKRTVRVWDEKTRSLLPEEVFDEILTE
jgi:uncharacterized protein YxeA